MNRPFQHNLVKVKNKKKFGVVQNLHCFYKNNYLASSILAFYLDPYFSFIPEKEFYGDITEDIGSEEDYLINCRIEKTINDKAFYAIINLQDYGYLQINSYREQDWKSIKNFSFLPAFSSIYHFDHKPISGSGIVWLDPLREKLKTFYFFQFQLIYQDVNKLVEKFDYQLKINNGNIYDVNESLVDHFFPERRVDLDLFFSEEDLKLLIYGMRTAIKPKYYQETSVITNIEEYKKFILNFYGEKGNCCTIQTLMNIF